MAVVQNLLEQKNIIENLQTASRELSTELKETGEGNYGFEGPDSH